MRSTEQERATLAEQISRDRKRRDRDGVGPLIDLIASPEARRALEPLAKRLLDGYNGVFSVCSASPGDGKTFISATLALLLAENSGRRVLLADAHIDRPAVHRLFGIAASPGFLECVRGRSRLRDVVSVVGKMNALPAGRDDGSFSPLAEGAAHRLIREMRQTFDFTLIDLPPLTGTNRGAAAFCNECDATIWVVRADATSARTVSQAVLSIDADRLLGVVLNQEQPELPSWLRRVLPEDA